MSSLCSMINRYVHRTAVHIGCIESCYICMYGGGLKLTVQTVLHHIIMIWLTSLLVFTAWYSPHTCFAQIGRPNATSFIRVFDDGGNEVLSVDVSTSTDALYSDNMLTITTSISFFTNRMYYLLADSGVHVHVYMQVCVCVCVCVCAYTGKLSSCLYRSIPYSL